MTIAGCGYRPMTPEPQTETERAGRRLAGVATSHADDNKTAVARLEILRRTKCLTEDCVGSDHSEGEVVDARERQGRRESGLTILGQTGNITIFSPVTRKELI